MTKIQITFPNKVDYSLLEAVKEALSYCPEEYSVEEIKDDNPVSPLDNLLKEYEDRNFWQDAEIGYSVEEYHNFLKSKLQSDVETSKEHPELPHYCNIAKQKCGCIGNFCSASGEQINSIFS